MLFFEILTSFAFEILLSDWEPLVCRIVETPGLLKTGGPAGLFFSWDLFWGPLFWRETLWFVSFWPSGLFQQCWLRCRFKTGGLWFAAFPSVFRPETPQTHEQPPISTKNNQWEVTAQKKRSTVKFLIFIHFLLLSLWYISFLFLCKEYYLKSKLSNTVKNIDFISQRKSHIL